MNYQELISAYEMELDSITFPKGDPFLKAEAGIVKTEEYLKKLRKLVIAKGFKNQKEEIFFFKKQKPKVFGQLVYFIKLFNIESKRPRGSSKIQIKFLNNQIDKLQIFFHDHMEFYHYYRRGLTSLDQEYFLRGHSDIRLTTESFMFYLDEDFSTFQDSTVAIFTAYEKLIKYLNREIGYIENFSNQDGSLEAQKVSKLYWTGSKTELVELIYALYQSGCVNRGAANIKGLAMNFEYVFNVELGNYYHTFIEIRARKSSKTKFLDQLKHSLIGYLEKLDQ